jgi:diguanylate cyclase
MTDDAGESEKWRNKYLESLEKLEEKERDWRRMDESLRHGLSRLALISAGLDPGLDVQLNKLRRALQNEVKSDYLDDLVAKISEYLKTLDEKGGKGPAADPDEVSIELLGRIVDAIEFPSHCQSGVKRLKHALDGRNAGDRLDQLVNEFAALTAVAFAGNEQPAGVKQGGWWKKLFAGDDAAPDSQAESARSADIEQSPEVVEPEAHVSPSSADAPSSTSPAASATTSPTRKAESIMLDFLHGLAFPAEVVPQLQQMNKQLEAGVPGTAVGEMVKSIVALINDVHRRLANEKEELELFLDQLGQRLQALDAMVDGAESQRLASLASGRELDEFVKAEVNDIEQTVSNVTEVVQMKGVIQGSLENIRRHLAEKRQQEEERQASLEQQLKAMNQRLADLEGESDRLRARLAQERVQAMTDPLTSIPNRLGYEKRLELEYARWQRYGHPLTMVVCDIDHFKRINDTYGHKAGDRALMAIAKSLIQHLRQTDFVARVGGEEFVVLLPETPMEDAVAVAEKLRKGVEDCEFVYEGTPVPITMSGGVAIFHEGDGKEAPFKRADKALYKAKQQGRNRFIPAS